MTDKLTAFLQDAEIAAGPRDDVQRLIEQRYPSDLHNIQVFDDRSGQIVDLDFWDASHSAAKRGRGRPNLGVRSREITLLPSQWDWLATQSGGASAVLRRLIDETRRRAPSLRERKDAIAAFLRVTCGDRANYEEALRALYRQDWDGFGQMIADWPADILRFVERLRRTPAEPAIA